MIHVNDTYKLFKIDLDEQNLTKLQEARSNPDSLYYEKERIPVLEYKSDEVNSESLVKMHCRGSSHKQPINLDNKLIVLVLHGFDIYMWMQPNFFDDFTVRKNKLMLIQKVTSKCLRIHNDSCLYFKTESVEENDGRTLHQDVIKRLTLSYCNYQIKTVYIDSDVKDKIMAFNTDNIKQKILVVCQSYSLPNDPVYTFKIFDMVKMQEEFTIALKNEELIGRLLSGLYTFVDGHIYFNNNVIKIRYDLIKTQNAGNLSENGIFDRYYNIFPLEENMRVRSNTPLNVRLSQRFAYIIQDRNCMETKVIRILPYLHARKIFLNEV